MEILEIVILTIMNLFMSGREPDDLEQEKEWVFGYLFTCVWFEKYGKITEKRREKWTFLLFVTGVQKCESVELMIL